MRSMLGTLRQWPRRRWVAVAVLAPTVAGVLVAVGPGSAWWGWALVPLIAGLAALILASYLAGPGSGRLIEVGCSPCAVVAGGAVIFAIFTRVGAPSSAGVAAIAMLALLGAVRQRLADALACETRST